jgi:hypothetical protein
VTGGLDAERAGRRRRAAVCADDTDLPQDRHGILGLGLGQRLGGGAPALEGVEAPRPVRRLVDRLGRDDADPRTDPRHDRARREHRRLQGDAELARLRVAGDDRQRHPPSMAPGARREPDVTMRWPPTLN